MTQALKLFIDDIRVPGPARGLGWTVAKSSQEAMKFVRMFGLPSHTALDHDLGGEDTTMVFLKALYKLFPAGPVPEYTIHSANPVGRDNITAFLESWKKSLIPEEVCQ